MLNTLKYGYINLQDLGRKTFDTELFVVCQVVRTGTICYSCDFVSYNVLYVQHMHCKLMLSILFRLHAYGTIAQEETFS